MRTRRHRNQIGHGRGAIAGEVTARCVVQVVHILKLFEQFESHQRIEERLQVGLGHIEVLRDDIDRLRSGRLQGVEKVEFQRGNQHVIPRQPLDRGPHRRSSRRLEVRPRPPHVRHRVCLLQLGIRGIAGLGHGRSTILPKKSLLNIFSWASPASSRANSESMMTSNSPSQNDFQTPAISSGRYGSEPRILMPLWNK